VQGEFIANQSI